jgi:chemotaxis protein histidine kinase CheA
VNSGLPPDLLELYQDELMERAARLEEGARALGRASLDVAEIPDLVRDAHTIKGSSRVVGLPEVGDAGAALEHAWLRLQFDDTLRSDAIARYLEAIARLLPSAAEREAAGDVTELKEAVTRLQGMLAGEAAPSKAAASVPAQAPPLERMDFGGFTALGGLLAEVHRSMMTGASRVETIELYRLINQAVEVSLDADALSDLAMVQFEGADPARLMAAWRSQLQRLSGSVFELQQQAVALANAPLSHATETFPQFVRYLGRKLDKDVRFESNGESLELDRQIVEMLREPLRHLLVNAVDHGLERPEERVAGGKSATGVVLLEARRDGDRVFISVSDDGRGIDWQAVGEVAARRKLGTGSDDLRAHLFLPGFSTVEVSHDFSGAGDGLSAVAEMMERVNGGVGVESRAGEGTTVTLTLPVSLILQNVLVVADGENFWGLPEASVQASIATAGADVAVGDDGVRRARFQSRDVPVVSLAEAMGLGPREGEDEVVVVGTRAGPIAVMVGEVLGRRRVAVKALGPILGGSRHLTGAALLGGGEVLVVVDPNYLGDYARSLPPARGRRRKILVVDDSAGVRQLIAATLSGRGYDVEVAPGAREAVLALAGGRFDALVVDYSMPRSSGVELVRALRAGNLDLPIVMVSGVANAEEQVAAWEAGVDAYLDKSDLRQGALTATLRALLGGDDEVTEEAEG